MLRKVSKYLLHAEALLVHVSEVKHRLCIMLLFRRHSIVHYGSLIVHFCAIAIVVVVTNLHPCHCVACTSISYICYQDMRTDYICSVSTQTAKSSLKLLSAT